MAQIRMNRIGEQIKKELSDIIQKDLKDPRIGFVTVTDVEMSGDLQIAKAFISILGNDKEKEETQIALEKAKGYMRSEIGRRIRLRHIPQIVFALDESLDYGQHINQLLRDVSQEKDDERVD